MSYILRKFGVDWSSQLGELHDCRPAHFALRWALEVWFLSGATHQKLKHDIFGVYYSVYHAPILLTNLV